MSAPLQGPAPLDSGTFVPLPGSRRAEMVEMT